MSDSETPLNTSDEQEYNNETTEVSDSFHPSDFEFIADDSEIDKSSESFVPSETGTESSDQSSRVSSFPSQTSGSSSLPGESAINISDDEEDIDMSIFPSFGDFHENQNSLPAEGQPEQIQEIDIKNLLIDSGTTDSEDSDVIFIERRRITDH